MQAAALAEAIRERFRQGRLKLPMLPRTVQEVQAIVEDEGKGAAEIAEALAQDASLSASVLRLANSSRFNPTGREIRSLPMAVQRLGGRRVLHLLVALSSRWHVSSLPRELLALVQAINEHALFVAAAARQLSALLKLAQPDEAFVAGLLHDVGAGLVAVAAAQLEADGGPEDARSVVCRLHREMGGRLLAHWGMPAIFVSVAVHHGVETDDRPHERLLDLVDAAGALVHGFGHPDPLHPLEEGMDAMKVPAVRRLGLHATHVAAVEVELEDMVQEIREAL